MEGSSLLQGVVNMSVFEYLILNISEPTVSIPLSCMAVDAQRMSSSNDMWRWSAGGWMKRIE